jgi:hypothetical protein
MSFKKIKFLLKIQWGLAFSLTEKHQFATKTKRKLRFLVREAHIPDQLYIMVVYIGFYGF